MPRSSGTIRTWYDVPIRGISLYAQNTHTSPITPSLSIVFHDPPSLLVASAVSLTSSNLLLALLNKFAAPSAMPRPVACQSFSCAQVANLVTSVFHLSLAASSIDMRDRGIWSSSGACMRKGRRDGVDWRGSICWRRSKDCCERERLCASRLRRWMAAVR